MPPPSSLFLPLPLGFPSCSSALSFSSLPWSPAKGHLSFLSSITAALLLIKDTHTHKDAYCTLSALGSPAASSHAETHKFYLTHGRTPFRLPPCHLRLTETSCDALRHAIKTGLFPLCGSQVNGSERSWLVSGPA